jgi:hypothetical protein
VIWPALDGFWKFDGSAITMIPCPIFDWFQQNMHTKVTRFFMAGTYNGAFQELWWSFPSSEQAIETGQNNLLVVYNFQEQWWSIGKLARNCGIPGTSTHYPIMCGMYNVYRHEYGNTYPDVEELPWIQSGAINVGKGKVFATIKQLLVDTDAGLEDVTYQISTNRGRYLDTGDPIHRRIGPAKTARKRGVIDYRISGRDFYLRMASQPGRKLWSFGEGQFVLAPRGKRSARAGTDPL